MTLNTKVPLMADKDIHDWIDQIIKHTHAMDLLTLWHRLDKELEDHKNATLIFAKINKMCDRCELVYPEHYFECLKCHNKDLRSFKVFDNLQELKRARFNFKCKNCGEVNESK